MLDRKIFRNRINAWVAALRSGKYKQTAHGLYKSDKKAYCCLGVACDISGLGYWSEPTSSGYCSYIDKSSKPPQTICLTQEVIEFYGLDTLFGSAFEDKLIGLNDKGKDFVTIADYIEASAETVFNKCEP